MDIARRFLNIFVQNTPSPMQGINAQSLNLPQELFDLLKDSVVTGRISHSFVIKTIKKRGSEDRKYIQVYSQPVQVGEIKDLGLNSLMYLMLDQFEYKGFVDGKYRFVRPYRDFTEDELAIHNASVENSITYQPEQIVEIEDTAAGETLRHHYGEEQYLRKAVKNKVLGTWRWEEIMTKAEAMELPLVPSHLKIYTFNQLDRWKDNHLTNEQFDALCFEERKLVDIDLNTDVANVFTEVAEIEEGKIGLAVYFNGLTPDEKPLSGYTAKPTGWWSRGYRIEWKLYNDQPLPEVLSDGVHDMRDTMAALSGVGNMGMVAKVYFDMDNENGYSVNTREIGVGEVPRYDVATNTFVYDPTKMCIIEGGIRILPIVSGKEATHECYINMNTKEVFRF